MFIFSFKQQKSLTKTSKAYCDRDRIRTCDRLLRRQMLYPAELRDPSRINYVIPEFVSGWQDSNLRPPAPKAGAITGLRYTPKKSAERRDSNPGNTFALTD